MRWKERGTREKLFSPFRGYSIWYRLVGDQGTADTWPLLCLHGCPGAIYDYLEPLSALAQGGRRIVLYDQLGCGRSAHPHDPSLWTVQLYVEEIAAVRQALGLHDVHLFGQSWGGMLALEYAVTRPLGLKSLILADTPASTAQFVAELNRLRAELPLEVQATLAQHEAAGTTNEPAYQEAVMVFYRRHMCRLDPWPDCLNRTFAGMAQWPEVYRTMWGPSEFHFTGTLREWRIEDGLGEIRVPTLVLGGRYDEVTPAMTETLHRGISGSEWVIFEQSAHMPHLEETELYLETVNAFLARVEATTQPGLA
ncbi:MAG: proline iminopeptidase-family hydrolase [Nitrospirota bacterium]|nr:proline iminopeptidase-family hydrolase [Nitrospirota bacterium]